MGNEKNCRSVTLPLEHELHAMLAARAARPCRRGVAGPRACEPAAPGRTLHYRSRVAAWAPLHGSEAEQNGRAWR